MSKETKRALVKKVLIEMTGGIKSVVEADGGDLLLGVGKSPTYRIAAFPGCDAFIARWLDDNVTLVGSAGKATLVDASENFIEVKGAIIDDMCEHYAGMIRGDLE